MSPNNIYLFTDAIHSGKTTVLQQWLKEQQVDAGGILTPDVDGLRRLYDIGRNEWHPLQVAQGHPQNDILEIGQYRFSLKGFQLAQEILLRAAKEDPAWLIADEVGMLELRRKTGLEPALTEIMNMYQSATCTGNLLLVVRDYLIDEVINMFGLSRDLVIYKSYFL